MPGSIATDELMASTLSAKVKDPLTDYLDFSMEDIATLLPVSGSQTHDGLSSEVGKTISLWGELASSDSAALLNTHDALQSTDTSLADNLKIKDSSKWLRK
jgi:hypothetical protein